MLAIGCLLTGAPEVAAAGPSLQAALDRWSEPEVADSALDASGLELDLGALRLEIESGSLQFLSGDGPAGFVFRGKGRFRFRSGDPDAERVERHNVSALLGPSHLRGGAIVGPVDRVLALGALPELPSLRDLPPADGTGRTESALASLLRSYRRNGLPLLDHAAVEAEANGAPAPLHVQLRGDAGSLLYVRDEGRWNGERLFHLERRRGLRAPRFLAGRPTGDTRRPPAPPFVLGGTRLEVVESGGLGLAIQGELQVVPSRDLRALRFALRNHQAGRDVPWDRGGRRITVLGLEDGDGRPLPFSHRYHELLVRYPDRLPAGRPARLSFRMHADIAVRPSGDSFFLLRTLPWFPRSDVDAEAYLMDWRVSTLSPFRPLVSGETIRESEKDGRRARRSTSPIPVRFGAVVAGKFECQEHPGRSIERLRFCSYLSPQPKVGPDVAGYFHALADTLSELLGPYPFSELTVAEIPTIDLAQSTPGLILLSSGLLMPNTSEVARRWRDAASRIRSRRGAEEIARVWEGLVGDAPKRMAHELAHTWWGQVVKYRDPGDQWLSESFAEYFGGLALARVAGGELLDQLRTVWRQAAERGNGAATLHTAHMLAGPEAFLRWSDLLYGKGPLVVDALRRELGDEAFLGSVRRLLRETAGGFSSTVRLTKTVQEECGRDIGPLLERWFYGTELP